MSRHAALSAAQTRHSGMASPDTAGCSRRESAASCASAPIISPKQSDVERRLCEWTRVLLIRDLSRAQRAHKATSSIRKALASATLGALQ